MKERLLLRGYASFQIPRVVTSHMTTFSRATCSGTISHILAKRLTVVLYHKLWCLEPIFLLFTCLVCRQIQFRLQTDDDQGIVWEGSDVLLLEFLLSCFLVHKFMLALQLKCSTGRGVIMLH